LIRDFYGKHRAGIAFVVAATAALATLTLLVMPGLAAVIGVATPSVLVVGGVIVNHWELVEKHGGRLIGAAARASTRAERVGLSAELQGLINGGRKHVSDDLTDLMPYPARVKFVTNESELASLRDGEIVIALKDPSKHAENAARATLAYVSEATIRTARAYVSPQVLTGVDFSLAKRILLQSDRAALDYLIGRIWSGALEGKPELRTVCHHIETIERHGLLTRVLLVEFLELGRRLYGEFPPPDVHRQTLEFVTHLSQLAGKERDQDVELIFSRPNFKIGIVLVGDRDLAALGVRPYLVRCLKDIRLGCESIYVLARGARCDLADQVVAELDGHGRVLATESSTYELLLRNGSRVTARVARLVIDQRGYQSVKTLDVAGAPEAHSGTRERTAS
jgi:hypothetical protein